MPFISSASVPVSPAIASELVNAALSAIVRSSEITWAGVVRSYRERPEPSSKRGWTPNALATWVRTTAAPAAVVPPAPNLAPRSLSSVSAKKLSDGVLVSSISFAIVGELTEVSVVAAAGVVPVLTGRPPAQLDPVGAQRRPQLQAGLQRGVLVVDGAVGVGPAAVVVEPRQLALDVDRRLVAGGGRALV